MIRFFLSVEDVLVLHEEGLLRYGGDPGLLDVRALESAVAQPAMTMFGEFLHKSLLDQAAAYLFHLVANHPFCDGNKRVGLLATLMFLSDNHAEDLGETGDWYRLTMGIASGELSKRDVAKAMAKLVRLP